MTFLKHRSIEEDELLNIQDPDIQKKFLKENNLSERNVKKLLVNNFFEKKLFFIYFK